MELWPSDFTDRAAAPQSVSICGIWGSCGLWDPGATVPSPAAADGTAAHRFHRLSCWGSPTPPSVSICEICGSFRSVGSGSDCLIHSCRRWNCSPQISQTELQGVPPPHLLCRSVESVGAVSLLDRCATVPSTAAADGTAAHRFHRLSCHPTFCVNLWNLWEL